MGAKVVRWDDVPSKQVEMQGVKNVEIRWLISEEDGAPHFAMRHFTVDVGGHTPCHDHNWEHEIYVLTGHGHLQLDDNLVDLSPGSVIFIPGGIEHQFIADKGEVMTFLCLIPNSGK